MFVVLYRPDIIFHYEILRYTKMSLGSYLLKHRKPHYRVIPEAVRGCKKNRRVDTFREITFELGPIKCDPALTDSVNRQSSKYT